MTDGQQQREIDLPSGTVRYREAGEGPPLVFVHGYLVDGRLWDGVVERLSADHRCIAPDWPLGAHRVPMSPDADLSPYGIAALIASLLERLELDEVTIVGNDTGGAMSQVLVARHPECVARLALTNCDMFENFPPGPFKLLPTLAGLPGAMTVLAAPFRIGAVARAAFRPFTRDPLPASLVASWLEPSRVDPGVRRDTQKVTVGLNKRYTLEAAEKLRGAELPLLLAWATGDRVFPRRYAERFAAGMPNARIVDIPDARTFVPIDQPERVADAIREFVAAA